MYKLRISITDADVVVTILYVYVSAGRVIFFRDLFCLFYISQNPYRTDRVQETIS